MTFADLQVSPAKEAGLALQRTYNSQDARPGSFGVGWQHAYDIRMEEENPSITASDLLYQPLELRYLSANHIETGAPEVYGCDVDTETCG